MGEDRPGPASRSQQLRAQAQDVRAQAQAMRLRSEETRERILVARLRTRELAHEYATLVQQLSIASAQDYAVAALGKNRLRDAVLEFSTLLGEQATSPEDSLKMVKDATEEVLRLRRRDEGHVADELVQWFCRAYYATPA